MEKSEVIDKLTGLQKSIEEAFKIGKEFEGEECEKAIVQCCNNLEYKLESNRAINPSSVHDMVSDLKSKLDDIVDSVCAKRDTERNETIYNLHQISTEFSQTIEDLEKFQNDGIAINKQNDYLHQEEIEQYIDNAVNDFIEKYDIRDVNDIYDIKVQINGMNGLKHRLGDLRSIASTSIKKAIDDKVMSVGEEMLSKNDKENDEIAKPPIPGLEDLTYSSREAGENMLKSSDEIRGELYSQFKDGPKDNTKERKSRSELEAMFK